ncbi:MAG: VTT domain-containing protein [Candidatus Ryanbacteria bacterium]|nr:VTT domain-containing protein [Candidatus Ryanbacteria bacterium]
MPSLNGFLFLHYLFAVEPLIYIGAFLGMVVEGEAALFAAAFIAEEGMLNPLLMWFVLVAGTVVGDALWYKLGKYVAQRRPRISAWIAHATKLFEHRLEARPMQTLFITKFVYGIHHLIVMRAGALNINLRTMLKNDCASSAIWVTLVGGIGYFSGTWFALARQYVRFAEVGLLIGLLLFLTLERAVAWVVKQSW